MKFIFSNKFFSLFIIAASSFLIMMPLIEVISQFNAIDLKQLYVAWQTHVPLRTAFKHFSTPSSLLLLLSFVVTGLLVIIGSNRDQNWVRPLGYISFGFLVVGAIGTFYAFPFNLTQYYQISAPMNYEKKGPVVAKIQFDILHPAFKKMLMEARAGRILCFVRTHLESNFSVKGYSKIKMNGNKVIIDKRNIQLKAKFLEDFLKNPQMTFEFELTDESDLVRKNIGHFIDQQSVVSGHKDELFVNNVKLVIPEGLLIYFLFTDWQGKPLATFL